MMELPFLCPKFSCRSSNLDFCRKRLGAAQALRSVRGLDRIARTDPFLPPMGLVDAWFRLKPCLDCQTCHEGPIGPDGEVVKVKPVPTRPRRVLRMMGLTSVR
jgi:hypothetical protein